MGRIYLLEHILNQLGQKVNSSIYSSKINIATYVAYVYIIKPHNLIRVQK